MILYQYLSHLEGITILLQRSSLDIIEAYQSADNLIELFRNLRSYTENNFDPIFNHAEGWLQLST